MPNNYTYQDPNQEVFDNRSITRLSELPIKKIRGSAYLEDPCCGHNFNMCGYDNEYFQPVCVSDNDVEETCDPTDEVRAHEIIKYLVNTQFNRTQSNFLGMAELQTAIFNANYDYPLSDSNYNYEIFTRNNIWYITATPKKNCLRGISGAVNAVSKSVCVTNAPGIPPILPVLNPSNNLTCSIGTSNATEILPESTTTYLEFTNQRCKKGFLFNASTDLFTPTINDNAHVNRPRAHVHFGKSTIFQSISGKISPNFGIKFKALLNPTFQGTVFKYTNTYSVQDNPSNVPATINELEVRFNAPINPATQSISLIYKFGGAALATFTFQTADPTGFYYDYELRCVDGVISFYVNNVLRGTPLPISSQGVSMFDFTSSSYDLVVGGPGIHSYFPDYPLQGTLCNLGIRVEDNLVFSWRGLPYGGDEFFLERTFERGQIRYFGDTSDNWVDCNCAIVDDSLPAGQCRTGSRFSQPQINYEVFTAPKVVINNCKDLLASNYLWTNIPQNYLHTPFNFMGGVGVGEGAGSFSISFEFSIDSYSPTPHTIFTYTNMPPSRSHPNDDYMEFKIKFIAESPGQEFFRLIYSHYSVDHIIDYGIIKDFSITAARSLFTPGETHYVTVMRHGVVIDGVPKSIFAVEMDGVPLKLINTVRTGIYIPSFDDDSFEFGGGDIAGYEYRAFFGVDDVTENPTWIPTNAKHYFRGKLCYCCIKTGNSIHGFRINYHWQSGFDSNNSQMPSTRIGFFNPANSSLNIYLRTPLYNAEVSNGFQLVSEICECSGSETETPCSKSIGLKFNSYFGDNYTLFDRTVPTSIPNYFIPDFQNIVNLHNVVPHIIISPENFIQRPDYSLPNNFNLDHAPFKINLRYKPNQRQVPPSPLPPNPSPLQIWEQESYYSGKILFAFYHSESESDPYNLQESPWQAYQQAMPFVYLYYVRDVNNTGSFIFMIAPGGWPGAYHGRIAMRLTRLSPINGWYDITLQRNSYGGYIELVVNGISSYFDTRHAENHVLEAARTTHYFEAPRGYRFNVNTVTGVPNNRMIYELPAEPRVFTHMIIGSYPLSRNSHVPFTPWFSGGYFGIQPADGVICNFSYYKDTNSGLKLAYSWDGFDESNFNYANQTGVIAFSNSNPNSPTFIFKNPNPNNIYNIPELYESCGCKDLVDLNECACVNFDGVTGPFRPAFPSNPVYPQIVYDTGHINFGQSPTFALGKYDFVIEINFTWDGLNNQYASPLLSYTSSLTSHFWEKWELYIQPNGFITFGWLKVYPNPTPADASLFTFNFPINAGQSYTLRLQRIEGYIISLFLNGQDYSSTAVYSASPHYPVFTEDTLIGPDNGYLLMGITSPQSPNVFQGRICSAFISIDGRVKLLWRGKHDLNSLIPEVGPLGYPFYFNLPESLSQQPCPIIRSIGEELPACVTYPAEDLSCDVKTRTQWLPKRKQICDPCELSCQETDRLYFQFQMPDNINNWTLPGPKFGWKPNPLDITNDWLATVNVYSPYDTLVRYHEFVEKAFVGALESGEHIQQIKINPKKLPYAFFFEFIFNLGNGSLIRVYSEPFKKVKCERTVVIEGIYNTSGPASRDCNGFYYGDFPKHNNIIMVDKQSEVFRYRNIKRIYADINFESYNISREEFVSRFTRNTTQTTSSEIYRLRTSKLPLYESKNLKAILTSKYIIVNGENYVFAGEVSKNIDSGTMWLYDIKLEYLNDCRIINFSCE